MADIEYRLLPYWVSLCRERSAGPFPENSMRVFGDSTFMEKTGHVWSAISESPPNISCTKLTVKTMQAVFLFTDPVTKQPLLKFHSIQSVLQPTGVLTRISNMKVKRFSEQDSKRVSSAHGFHLFPCLTILLP